MSGLFASANTQQKPNLFGSLNTSNTNQQPQQTSLFGQSQPQNNNQAGSSLFGANNTQQQKPQLSLFGGQQNQTQNATNNNGTGGGLFGQSQQQSNTGGGLFGSTNQQQQQKPSLFGAAPLGSTTNQQQPSLFGGSQAQQQQNAQPTPNLGASALGVSANRSSLWTPNQNLTPHIKTIPEQMTVLLSKWNYTSPDCVFQHYFYNQVPDEQAPYFAPGPGEDEKKWEEALKSKPTAGSVPVLARGAFEVGKRLEMQSQCVNAIRARLHELNEVLTRRLQAHELQYTVRAQEARRRHVALSRRCLALAAKAQILRNRGYTLDSNEEALKTKLQELERLAFDPMLSGRQEEVWARLSVLRQRAEMLKKEADNTSRQIDSQTDNPLDEEQMQKVEKILGNYELQLNQLKKERESAEADFLAWEKTQSSQKR